MKAPPFHNFSTTHIVVIVLTFSIPLLLGWIARSTRSERFVRAVAAGLTVLLLGGLVAYYLNEAAEGTWTIARSLPMQLCDWSLVATVGALWLRNIRWFELAYFWGIGGTLQAILTPNLKCGFPSVAFLSFFTIHSGIVCAVLFMIVAMRLRPQLKSLPRVLLWSELYLACALLVNAVTGGNYGYLSHKPEGHSMLDFFSDSRLLYIAEINIVAILFFLILYLPFFVVDQFAGFTRTAPSANNNS